MYFESTNHKINDNFEINAKSIYQLKNVITLSHY